MARLISWTALLLSSFSSAAARAEPAVLLAAGDPEQIGQVQVAQVIADDSTVWLRVELSAHANLALVVSRASLDDAPGADAWLRALDFATRMRVAAPPDSGSSCVAASVDPSRGNGPPLVDTGVPTAPPGAAFRSSMVDSELDLRRLLADAQLSFDVDSTSRFTERALPPYEALFYRSGDTALSTSTLRISQHSNVGELPSILAVAPTRLPLSFIALASAAVLPAAEASVDPSEFPVLYRFASQSSDYRDARSAWAAQYPTRWLSEAEATSGLFAWTVLSSGDRIAPALLRYLDSLPSAQPGACRARIEAARARNSLLPSDYACQGADDLALSVGQLGSSEPRLTRLFGSLGPEGAVFRVQARAAQSPLLVATDSDEPGCLPIEAPLPIPMPASPRTGSTPNEPGASDARAQASPVYDSDGSCNGVVLGGGDVSCSGDAQASDAGSDSCSGDSDPSANAEDSCSGNSDSGSDSGGCGKSEYDGDTCSGDSAHSTNSALKSRAALESSKSETRRPPRRVRLSLVALLTAALGLPLRRVRASR